MSTGPFRGDSACSFWAHQNGADSLREPDKLGSVADSVDTLISSLLGEGAGPQRPAKLRGN
jgi:hypothetical protein